jgi:hypothetical protein
LQHIGQPSGNSLAAVDRLPWFSMTFSVQKLDFWFNTCPSSIACGHCHNLGDSSNTGAVVVVVVVGYKETWWLY